MQAAAIDISNAYRSPRNPERKVRRSTELIVLHTTEAPAKSSLNKVSDRGECHFVVTEEGSVYAIVDRDREAFHAGRSMWNGREDVDKFSVGIECVGYHDKPMGKVQLAAIAQLVKELKAMYRIPDERVVCHSHVAYGAPNKWQKRQHRGRKRCGMLFAMASVRRVLGLKARPAIDTDTRSGRLAIGDNYLQTVLYGNVDTMTAYYGQNAVPVAAAPAPPSSGSWVRRLFTSSAKPPSPSGATKQVKKWTTSTVTKVSKWPKASDGKKKSNPATTKAKPAAATAKPTPAKSSPTAKPAAKPPSSIAELKAQGYVVKGTISKSATALRIAGAKWNASETYYTIRDKVYSGKGVDPAKLEKGMSVWMKP